MKVVEEPQQPIEVALPGLEKPVFLQQPNLSHFFIFRTRKDLMELLHFKMNVWQLGQILNACNRVLMSFNNAFEIRTGES